jgi:hypothetical protein
MKKAIDLEGNWVSLPNDKVVKNIDGINYILTPEEEEEFANRNAQWELESPKRELKEVIRKRQASIANGGYGTPEEQLDILINQGFAALKAHSDKVKKNFVKPEIEDV